MSEEAKVGLVDDAIAIVSIGQKEGVKRSWRFWKKWELYSDVSRDSSDTDESSDSLRPIGILSMQSLFVFFASHSSARILFRLRHFARPASRKTELRQNYLFALSAFRNTKVLGDLRVNFTTKLTVVNFTSADWLSYLRTQLKAFVDRVLGGVCLRSKIPFFLALFSRMNFFFSWSIHFKELQRKESLFDCPQIWTVTRLTYVSGNCLFRNITSPRAIFARSLHITSCYFEIKIFCNFLLQLNMAKRRQLFLALSVLKPRKQTNWRKTKFALTCSFQKMIRALVFSCFENFGNLFSTFGVLRNYIFWDVG